MTAADLISLLDLKPLPLEGGWFRETYRSPEPFVGRAQEKYAATAIYYLLTPDTFSALHRLPTDEVFHFYAGDPVTMLQLDPDGGRVLTIGNELAAGQRPQVLAPRGVWQGSFLREGGQWALMGTTVAPGFDFSDYEAGDREALIAQYPDWADPIRRLTRV